MSFGVVLDAEALAHKAVDILSEHQALDIALLDISRTATFTDFFVIATAQSPLQFKALAEFLEKDLKQEGHDLRHQEGSADSGWLLLDFGELIAAFLATSSQVLEHRFSFTGRQLSHGRGCIRGSGNCLIEQGLIGQRHVCGDLIRELIDDRQVSIRLLGPIR